MGEIHELFVLALSLVWFAGATPERNNTKNFLPSCQRHEIFLMGSREENRVLESS